MPKLLIRVNTFSSYGVAAVLQLKRESKTHLTITKKIVNYYNLMPCQINLQTATRIVNFVSIKHTKKVGIRMSTHLVDSTNCGG